MNAERLTQVLNANGSTTISQHVYTLDNVGNRTQVQETLAQVGGGTANNTINYAYDQLYRLTGDGTRSYSYDPVGNRLSLVQGSTTTNYTFDKADRIQSAGTTSYSTNADGDVTARGSDGFTYDQENRLLSATINGTTSSYTYDGDGKRASKTVGTTTTSYVYDASTSLPVVLTDGTLKYVYGAGLAYTVDSSGNIQVAHMDGLGSVRALTNGSGSVVQTYQTDPFGVSTQTQGTSTQPFQFTGQQQDVESSFYYLRARYYDPATGRFLTRDTVAGDPTAPQSLNRFACAQNNPSTLTDPSGKCLPECLVLGLYVVGVGVSAYQTAQAFADPNSSLKQRLLSTGLLIVALDPEGGIAEGAAETASGITTVFRVESLGNARLEISAAGDVAIKGENTLFLNFGDEARAQEFFARRLSQGYEGTVIKSFQVPTSYVAALRESAVPESLARRFPGNPIMVDVNQAADQFGLRAANFGELLRNIIPGSGYAP